MEPNALNRGVSQRLGFRRGFARVGVHPGIVLADVDHLEKERVQAAALDRGAEGVLVQQRRAGSHHHAVEFVVANVLLDQFLARVGAHVLVVAGQNHPG